MMKDNHPKNAIKIPFKPLGAKQAIYWVWSSGNNYYWSCQGQSGKEDNLETAMRAAREWVLYGINGLASHGEYRGVGNEGRQQSN